MNLQIFVVLSTVALASATAAGGQSTPGALGVVGRGVSDRAISQYAAPISPLALAPADEGGGMPSWVKWGLVGAAGGAITFGVLGETSIDDRKSFGQNAATGAVAGFVIVGGAVAFYNWVCAPDSGSRRAGLCGN